MSRVRLWNVWDLFLCDNSIQQEIKSKGEDNLHTDTFSITYIVVSLNMRLNSHLSLNLIELYTIGSSVCYSFWTVLSNKHIFNFFLLILYIWLYVQFMYQIYTILYFYVVIVDFFFYSLNDYDFYHWQFEGFST